VPLRQPLAHVRRHQKCLLTTTLDEVLRHARMVVSGPDGRAPTTRYPPCASGPPPRSSTRCRRSPLCLMHPRGQPQAPRSRTWRTAGAAQLRPHPHQAHHRASEPGSRTDQAPGHGREPRPSQERASREPHLHSRCARSASSSLTTSVRPAIEVTLTAHCGATRSAPARPSLICAPASRERESAGCDARPGRRAGSGRLESYTG
jgi:hypothetical protein